MSAGLSPVPLPVSSMLIPLSLPMTESCTALLTISTSITASDEELSASFFFHLSAVTLIAGRAVSPSKLGGESSTVERARRGCRAGIEGAVCGVDREGRAEGW